MIAVLFAQKSGIYSGLPDIDLWPIDRDARKYTGPHSVIAHPPCARWSLLASLVESVYGYKKGNDGGCFESALNSVRTYGGVLEHPAFTAAFPRFGITRPTVGGWQASTCGGWVAQVDQGHYGHRARKATWLYVFGVEPEKLPGLPCDRAESSVWISDCQNHARGKKVERMGKRERSATPEKFKQLLIDIAESI